MGETMKRAAKSKITKRKITKRKEVHAVSSEEWKRRAHWHDTFYAALSGFTAVRGADVSLASVMAIHNVVEDAQAVADYACAGRPPGCGRPATNYVEADE
jgi:hypothetical protein